MSASTTAVVLWRGRTEEETPELPPTHSIRFRPFFFNDPATTEIYTLSLHDALPISLAKEVQQLSRDGVRLHFIGDRSGLSEKVCAGLAQAEQVTAHNNRLVLNVCFNYGGCCVP